MSSAVPIADNAAKDHPPVAPFVTYNGKKYKITSEGNAEILEQHRQQEAASGKKGVAKPQSVFYNPIQQYNRDLSVLAIRVFGEDYVAIQRARRHKRAVNIVGGGQQGKKRKRWQAEGKEDGEGLGTKKKEAHTAVNDGHMGAETPPCAPIAKDAAVVPGSVEAEAVDTRSNGLQEHSDTMGATEPGGQHMTGKTVDKARNPKETENKVTPTKQVPFRILDALSASGLRALRYAKEIPTVTSVTANDLSSSATASIKLNVSHNELNEKIIPTTSDAIQHMHEAASRFTGKPDIYHVIDLDPYGTAAPFLDAAVQALADGGLLCVTCTDAGVFASIGYLEKTYSQYGGLPLKGAHAHEAGLRLILHAIATSAARYGLAIEPLLSLSIDFYARVFVRIHRSPAEVKFLASKTMMVFNCDSGCGAWATQYLARAKAKTAKNGDTFYSFSSALAPSTGTHCEHCGFKTHLAGPMWGGRLHNPHFIQRILDTLPTLDKEVYGTIPRIEGMLSVALDEALEDEPSDIPSPATSSTDRPVPTTHPASLSHHPFFILPSALSRVIHCVSPSDAAVRGALIHLGYRTTRSHTKAGSICTNAPWSVIWEVMREWARQKSPIKEGAIKKNTAGWGIMQKDRSNRKMTEVKEAFKIGTENGKLDELTALKTHLAAALYRLSKDEDDESPEDAQAEESITKDTDDEEGASEVTTPPKPTCTSDLKIVFDEALGREPQGKRMVKYQINPRPDWGPINRARGA